MVKGGGLLSPMEREFCGPIGVIEQVPTVRFDKHFEKVIFKVLIGSSKCGKTHIPRTTGQRKPTDRSTGVSIIVV